MLSNFAFFPWSYLKIHPVSSWNSKSVLFSILYKSDCRVFANVGVLTGLTKTRMTPSTSKVRSNLVFLDFHRGTQTAVFPEYPRLPAIFHPLQLSTNGANRAHRLIPWNRASLWSQICIPRQCVLYKEWGKGKWDDCYSKGRSGYLEHPFLSDGGDEVKAVNNNNTVVFLI